MHVNGLCPSTAPASSLQGPPSLDGRVPYPSPVPDLSRTWEARRESERMTDVEINKQCGGSIVMEVPQIAGWFSSGKIPHPKMDED